MSDKAKILSHLRLLPSMKITTTMGEAFEAPGLAFPLRRGLVIELIGSAPAEFVVEFLVMNRYFVVFWCEKDQRIFPPYLEQRGFDVTSIRFGTYQDKLQDALHDLLRNQLYDVVIAPTGFKDISLDRFGRLARDAGTLVFLLGSEEKPCSQHIDLHLEVHRGDEEGTFNHRVLKIKNGRL